MKQKFTLLIALALIFSASYAQEQRVRLGEPQRIELGITSNSLTLQKAVPATVNQAMPPMQAPGDVLFSEGFDGTTFPPTDWYRVENGYATPTWARNTTAAYIQSGAGSAGHSYTSAAANVADGWLITPQINVPSTGIMVLKFWYYVVDGSYAPTDGSACRIMVSTAGSQTTTGDYTVLKSFDASELTDGAHNMTVSLADYAGQSIYLAFRYGGGDGHVWYIDNVNVIEAPDNDLALTPIGYPYSQVASGQQLVPTSVTLTNNGTATQTGIVATCSYNGTVIATQNIASLAAGVSQTVDFTYSGINIVQGTNTLVYNVTQSETEQNPVDNSFTTTFTGTPHLFATDNGSIATYLGGTGTSNYRYGTVYTFTSATTINQVQAYFYTGHATTNNAYTLRVQQVTNPTTGTISSTVLNGSGQTFTVGTGTIWANVNLTTPLTLDPGSYFISISCSTTANYMLADNGSENRMPFAATTSTGTTLNYGTGSAFLRLMVNLVPNDIQINPTTGFLYTQIPQSIAGDLPFPTLSAKADNIGTTSQTGITFSATYNGTDLGTSSPIATLAVNTTSAAMTITPPAGTVFPTTLSTNNIVYSVSQNETDENPDDNSLTRSFDITHNIYALDNVADNITDGGVGYGGSTPSGLGYKVGNIFNIPTAVTLKQVQIGFGAGATAIALNLVLYQATLSAGTYSVTGTDVFTPISIMRPDGGGWMTVDVPPTVLTPGVYFLGVQSTANDNHDVAYDRVFGNTIYLAAATPAGSLTGQDGSFGAGAIRMVLDVCTAPTALTVNGINSDGATISWTPGDTETEWTLEYATDATFTENEVTIDNITPDPTYTLTGLDDNTTYYVRVKSVCGADESDWSDAVNFTTQVAIDQCGDGIVVGTGTTTQNYVPIYAFYGYNYSQTIYYGSDIAAAGGTANDITKIAYHWNGGGNINNSKDWTIWIGQTDKTTFSSTTDFIPLGSMQQVFDGIVSLPTAAGWMNIALDAPFAWDGTSNIVVAVYEHTPDYSTSGVGWYSTTGANRTIYAYQDAVFVPTDAATAITTGRGTTYPNITLNLCEPLDNDAAITAIITPPTNGINLTATEHVTATLKNLGVNPITTAQMKLTVNGTPIATETYTGPLTTGNTTNFTFAATADMSAAGDYTITVEVIMPGDENADNNSMTKTVTNTICNTVSSCPYTENWDSGTFDCWTTINTHPAASSNWAIVDYDEEMGEDTGYGYIAEINYTDDQMMNERLISPVFDFSSYESVNLSFDINMSYYWMVYPNNGADINVEVTTDGGTTWTSVWDETVLGVFDNWVWYTQTVNLTAYAGNPNVQISFHYVGDDGAAVYLDNIQTSCIPTSIADNSNKDIAVYPNPVTTTFVIKNAAGSQAKIYDVSGKLVYNAPVANDNQTVDISNVASGIYFLELQSSTSKSTVKLIKK